MSGLTTTGLADLMGVKTQTIRNWVKAGKIPHHTTPTGRAYFSEEDIKNIQAGGNSTTPHKTAHYARSSKGSQTTINNQLKHLKEHYGEPDYEIRDSGSGLNENRKGLTKLLDLARDSEINEIRITTQDRLTRFGYKYLERYLNEHGVTITVLEGEIEKQPEMELVDDFMTLISSFSSRYYHIRNVRNEQRFLDEVAKKMQEES